MFQALGCTFQGLGCTFQGLGYTFQALKRRIQCGLRRFSTPCSCFSKLLLCQSIFCMKCPTYIIRKKGWPVLDYRQRAELMKKNSLYASASGLKPMLSPPFCWLTQTKDVAFGWHGKDVRKENGVMEDSRTLV